MLQKLVIGLIIGIIVFSFNVSAAECSIGSINAECSCGLMNNVNEGYCCTSPSGPIWFDSGYDLYWNNSYSCSLNYLYVDINNPSCSDSGSGSETQPFCTVNRPTKGDSVGSAVDWIGNPALAAVAGDAILVRTGTYDTGSPRTYEWPSTFMVNQGTNSNPIIIRSYPGDQVNLTGDTNVFGVKDGSNNVWDGFRVYTYSPAIDEGSVVTIRGANRALIQNNEIIGQDKGLGYFDNHAGIGIAMGITVPDTTNSIIRNNIIHGVKGEGHNNACIIQYDADNIIIENNELYDCNAGMFIKGWTTNFGDTYRYNLIHDVDEAIHFGRMGFSEIYQNIIYDSGSGISGEGDNKEAESWEIYNNLIYNGGGRGFGGSITINGGGYWLDINYYNNIVSNITSNSITLPGGTIPGTTSDYNGYYNPLGPSIFYRWEVAQGNRNGDLAWWRTNTGFDTNSIEVNPEFVDAPNLDFHLSPTSLMRNYGIDYKDLDNDGQTNDLINLGPYVIGNEVIGVDRFGVNTNNSINNTNSSNTTTECINWQATNPNWLFCDDFEEGFASWDSIDTDAILTTAPSEIYAGTSAKVTAHLGGGGDPNFNFVPSVEQDQLHVRYYVKFDTSTDWPHHMGGISARASSCPSCSAGLRPLGDEGFWASLEPNDFNTGSGTDQYWHLYTYWQEMHSWGNMDGSTTPECESSNTCYYGNSFTPVQGEPIQKDRWYCIEHMMKTNTPNLYDGEQSFWVDDVLMNNYAIGNPTGSWNRDNFFTWGPYYNAGTALPFEGYNWRTDSNLKINSVQLEWYHSSGNGPEDIVYYDNVVISTEKIGCVETESPTCSLPYDTSPTCNNCIDAGELSSTISGWFNNQINIAQLVVNIKNWKSCN